MTEIANYRPSTPQACKAGDLLFIAVAPHTVYGPRDNLFLPNLLEAAGVGKLRVFGRGESRVGYTHVDNYCHGLIIAEKQIYEGSPHLSVAVRWWGDSSGRELSLVVRFHRVLDDVLVV